MSNDNFEKGCKDVFLYLEGDINSTESEIKSFLGYINNFKKNAQFRQPFNISIMSNNQDIYPNLCLILGIILTVPVTVASGEGSFSKLKIIENYLRSSVTRTPRSTGTDFN